MHNSELAKSTKFHLQHDKNVQQNYVWCIYKANASHLDENIAALWVWLNSSKSDDLWTNTFSTGTKRSSQGKKYLLYLLVTIVATLQEARINVYFILISESSPYVLSYRSIYS